MRDIAKPLIRHPILLILALGLAIRLPMLSSRPLWYDEAFAVLFSAKGLGPMLQGTLQVEGTAAADVHPLLYYTVLEVWARLLGTSPIAVRALSVIAGLGVIAAGYAIGRDLFDGRAAAIGGVLLAFSPFQVHYSQEVRMYAQLALLLLMATWAFWRGMERGKSRYWVAFALLAAAAQYTHNLAAMYLLPLSITPLLRRRWGDALRTLAAGGAAILLYLPWLLRLPSQLARIQQAYWIPRPGASELVRTLITLVVGLPVPGWTVAIALAISVLVLVTAGWLTFRAWRSQVDGAARAAWLAYLGLAPIALMFVISQWSSVYLDRALVASAAAVLLWLGWLLSRTNLPAPILRAEAAALIAACALGLYGFFSYRGFPYAPYAALDEYLATHRGAAEEIIHSNKISAVPALYYGPGLEMRYIADPPHSGSDTLAPATQHVLGFIADADIIQAAGDASGVWFVIFPREIDEYRAQGYADHPALAWLTSNYSLADQQSFGELRVYHFVRMGPPA